MDDNKYVYYKSVQKKPGDRRSLIESLGAENKEEKLVLYIPEESVIGSSSPLLRSKSLRAERKRDGGDPNLSFDRFASMRRSRRYKKEEPEVELEPVKPTRTSSRWKKSEQGRSASNIEPQHVAQALRLHNSNSTSAPNKSNHLVGGDRDEGFEECGPALPGENETSSWNANKLSTAGASNKDKSKWSSLLMSRQKNKVNDKKVDPNHNEIKSLTNGSAVKGKEIAIAPKRINDTLLTNGSVNKKKENTNEPAIDEKKGLPRLYSFMRPTAASSAKDRAERIKNASNGINGTSGLLNRSASVNKKKPSPSASLFSKHSFR